MAASGEGSATAASEAGCANTVLVQDSREPASTNAIATVRNAGPAKTREAIDDKRSLKPILVGGSSRGRAALEQVEGGGSQRRGERRSARDELELRTHQ